MTWWAKIKLYFGVCPHCSGDTERWSLRKIYCTECGDAWRLS